jgi:hypothetical protein
MIRRDIIYIDLTYYIGGFLPNPGQKLVIQ